MQRHFYHYTKPIVFSVHVETSKLDSDTFDYYAYVDGKCVASGFGYETADIAEQTAKEECDEIAEMYPKICRGEGIPTEVLKNEFYFFAQSAPAWTDEVLNLVAESKLRRWLIEKLQGIMSIEEMIDVFGKYIKQ